jgi:hypothetical protein
MMISLRRLDLGFLSLVSCSLFHILLRRPDRPIVAVFVVATFVYGVAARAHQSETTIC